MLIQSQHQSPSHNQMQRGVGRWRPALLFALLPTLIGLTLLITWRAPVQAQTPSPTFAVEQVTPPNGLPSAPFGRESFAQNCAPCHGDTGLGDGPTAASMPYSPTAFADPNAVWALSPAELFHTAKFGRIERLMPPWQNQLSDDEIWQTVMYAWSLHTNADAVASGQTLYAESCASCHGDTGAGDGPEAPVDLTNFADPTSTMVKSQEDWLAGWQEAHPELGQEWSLDQQSQVLEYIRTFSYIPAWESGYRAGDGVIRGVVTQGSVGEPLPEGLVATLDAYAHFTLAESFTATVDAAGNFVFNDLSVEENMSYLVSVDVGEVSYSSPLVMLTADAPEADTAVTIYATSDQASDIRISRTDWIIDDQPGALLVVQLYFFGSGGDRTFVGAPVEGVDVPVTVGIHVPSGAEQVTFESGEIGERFQQVGDLYYDTTPLVPGQGTKQIVVRYLLPYDDTSISYAQQFLYPNAQTNLLVAELPQLQATITPPGGPAWQTEEVQEFQGRNYLIFRGPEMGAGEVTIELSGLLATNAFDPREEATTTGGANSDVTFASWMAWSIGSFGILMMAGVVLWSWNNGRMQLSTRPPDLRKEVDTLARRIAQLDDRYALGEVPPQNYQQQRSQLKARMLELARRVEGTTAEQQVSK